MSLANLILFQTEVLGGFLLLFVLFFLGIVLGSVRREETQDGQERGCVPFHGLPPQQDESKAPANAGFCLPDETFLARYGWPRAGKR